MRICCGGCKITSGSSSFSSSMSLWTPDPSGIFRDNVEAFLDNDRFANSIFFRNKKVVINRMTGVIYKYYGKIEMLRTANSNLPVDEIGRKL